MRWWAVLALALPCAVLAEDADFVFSGPAPARNFQPIQLIFLHLPFERAATLRAGELAFHIDSAESNVIATSDGRIDARLKFETNRTVLGARYGVAPGWEVGIDLPFITRYGGFLDPFIDAVESAFDSTNSERDIFPEDEFGAFIVRKGQTVLFEGGKETFQPGDLWFSVKREFRLPDPWPLLALRGAIKAPSGDEDDVLGSGKPDFGLGLAAEHRPLSRLMLFLNLNLVYPVGPITNADLTLNPIFTQSFAAEVALARRWSLLYHQALYTSPFHGNGAKLLDGTVVELGFAINFAFREWLGVQLLAINNVSGVEQAADFSVLLALNSRGWRLPFVTKPSTADLPPLSDAALPPAIEMPSPGDEQTPSVEPAPIEPALPPLREELHRQPEP